MRASGILMPVFSLPGPYGIGTLGDEAFAFVDFLAAAKQTYWQILPIGPTGYGDSPYQSFSAFAGNPYFIDYRLLAADGLLTEDELPSPQPAERIDYGALYQQRPVVLRKAAERLLAAPTPAYKAFCEAQSDWLEDYALSRMEGFSGVVRSAYSWAFSDSSPRLPLLITPSIMP